jgi:L-2,4-diaminobutyrate decarboxylase
MAADGTRMHRFSDDVAALAEAVLQYALARMRWDPPPLDGPKSPAELAAAVGETVTPGGLGGFEALRLWMDELAPACTSQDHPRSLAFVPAAPTEAAVLFDLVVGASSMFGGGWLDASGAVYAENQALRWIADLAGLPAAAGGCFVQGGTAGNLSALVAARHHAAAQRAEAHGRPARWVVAGSAETHSSVLAAARVMDVDVLDVPVDDRGRMTGPALAAALDRHDAAAGVPFAVVATAGTTNLGTVDDLAGIADVCAQHGLWLHVDGAYGGAALAAPSVRNLFDGIEHADSLVVDPHKWLFSPFDCCALVYRDPEIARAAHTQHAAYLDAVHRRGEWNPSDYAIQLTRRARGLPFWFSLATHGTDAYTDAIELTLATARGAAALVDAAPHLEVVSPPELSVILFRRLGWDATDYDAWSARMLDEGTAISVPTTHRGETVMRWCFVNPRTTLDDVRMLVDTMA